MSFQPNSETSSESGGVKGRKKTANKSSMDKSKLDTFKDFLHSKLKKGRKQESQVKDQEGLFHGFSEDEVLSASLNDSSSERSSIISSLSNEEKNEKKKRRSEAKAAAAAARAVSDAAPGDRGVPLLHQSLVVEGKRQKKLSFKLQEKNDASQVWCFIYDKAPANPLFLRPGKRGANLWTASQTSPRGGRPRMRLQRGSSVQWR